VTEQTLAHARAGDENAFRELTDPYRRELQTHIYRIVGSAQDAEDVLQETPLGAWRGLEQFQGRAWIPAWLYRIATNRSLDALRASRRRPQDRPRMSEMPEPTRPPAPPAPTARGARAARCPRLRRPRGRRDARDHRAVRQQPAAPRACGVPVAPALQWPRTGAVAELQAQARDRRPLRRRHPDRRHRRRRRAAHRRRLADDAARALRVPGRWPDRRVPARPHGPARRAAAGADPREHRAGLRLLLPTPQTEIARPTALLVLTLQGGGISAITWFGGSSVFALFGLPRILR
jgi:RNA polymerase sigma-70 factor, ECF subfamily